MYLFALSIKSLLPEMKSNSPYFENIPGVRNAVGTNKLTGSFSTFGFHLLIRKTLLPIGSESLSKLP